MAEEKKKNNFIIMLVYIVVAVGISMTGTYFLVKYLNAPATSENPANQIKRVTAVLIRSGSDATFPLRGGSEVLVIDSLSFLVGSQECSQKIGLSTPQIMDGLQTLILSKSANEILNPDGLQTLKQQISDLVDQITGYTGNKAAMGVLQVYMYIKAVSPV